MQAAADRLESPRARARSPSWRRGVSWAAGVLLATAGGAIFASDAAVAAEGIDEMDSANARATAHAVVTQIDQKRLLSYPFEQVWPTAVRYLRIDRGYKIEERDPEAGFILFSFLVGNEKTGSGSLEMLRTVDAAGRPSVQVLVNTGAGPSHLPHTILDGLTAKVRAERGQPAPPPPKETPPPPADDPPPDGGGPPMMPPAQEPGQPP